jgi:hypothetical protein
LRAGSSAPDPHRPSPARRLSRDWHEGETHYYEVAPEDLDQIEVPTLATEATLALEIRGTSLGSHLNHWFVLYDDVRKPATLDLVGELCVVALDDGRVVIKQVQQGKVAGEFDLISQADPPIHRARIAWAAIVKAIIQR